jgi:hypothetical protein
MSRILRRPMFRGGPASSDGVGITSGLNNPRQGYADGPTEEGVNRSDITTEDVFKPYTLAGDAMRLFTNLNELGYNYGVRPVLNLPKLASNYVLGTKFEQTPSVDYTKELIKNLPEEQIQKIRKEKEKQINKKISDFKPSMEPSYEPEKTVIKNALPTLGQDIDTYTKLLMENAGPDKDEYTRQKYLTLAKFGLNLLKPTPVGIKPSLATSIASAAEKPLEEYGNIAMQQSKEERALKQAAAQMAFQKHMPGPLAKTVQDIMASDPNMTLEDATSRALTGKSLAQQHKEERLSIGETAKRLSENPNLKGLDQKDPATLQLLAKIVEKGVDDTQIKGPIDKYNYPTENSYYTNVINPKTGQREVAHYYKGQYHFIGEPNFIVKPRGI